MKRLFIGAVVIFLLLATASIASAYVAASANYQLEKDSLNFGGADFSSSANYLNSGTLGEIISGLTNGTSYNASSGYRYMNADPAVVWGCTDSTATNYSSIATRNDGSCFYQDGGGTGFETYGCRDPNALNYNIRATADDGSCVYASEPIPPIMTEPDDNDFFPSVPNVQVITQPSWEWNFRFFQPGEPEKTFDQKMQVRIVGNKNLTILFNYNLAPATLKTIGITLTDPTDKTKTFSFLMHLNKAGTAYEATIAPLIRSGTYPLDIYIVNYDNQAITRIRGRLIVLGTGMSLVNMIVPIAAATGLIVGFLPSLYDLLVALYRLVGSWFGRRKNDNPWGTVYDSVTKRPLDPVYLTVSQADKEMATAITDIDGRFSFFLLAGAYTIKANKTHYRFPSERLAGQTADELYDHLYFGGELVTNDEAIVNINIPMDSVDFDWNEFAKTKTNFFLFYNRRRRWLSRLYNLIFVSGFLLSIYSLFLSLIWWNIAIVVLYLGIMALNYFWPDRNKPLRVMRADINEPLPFAIIRVFLPDLNQQIKSIVADKLGRFYLLVRPGVYYYTVEEKQLDGSYLKVFQSQPVSLPKGVLTTDIQVK